MHNVAMKIAQTECDTLQLGIATGATPTESSTPPIETRITTRIELKPTEGAAERVVEKLLKYNENACNDNGAVTTTMTDDHNNIVVTTTNNIIGNNTNNNNSIINKNVTTSTTTKSKISTSTTAPTTTTTSTTKPIVSHNKDNIIAEATKILIKNALNGTTAVAAAASLLTVAATFQLPPPRPVVTPDSRSPTSASTFHRQSSPPPAHSGNSHKIASSLAAASASPSGSIDVNAHNRHSHLSHRKFLNNGTSPAASATAPAKPMAATTTNSSAQMRLGISAPANAPHLGSGVAATSSSNKADLSGAIDYTFHAGSSSPLFGANHNHHNKYPVGGSSNSRSEFGRTPLSGCTSAGTGAGGTLQFFKDGKFILELARSKDGEGKSGWISVPRKLFRTPSAATSSTVTPTLATTTAYPKNETSTSLSFSDDNSSIQSSPWQRDHCWKQSAPRRGISKEMSLYFWRPRAAVSLTTKGLEAAHRKRRKPLDPPEKCESGHFEWLRKTHMEEFQDVCKEQQDKNDPQKAKFDSSESAEQIKQEVTESVQSQKISAENEKSERMDISGIDTEDGKTPETHLDASATTTERSGNILNAEQHDKPSAEVEHQEMVDTQDPSENSVAQNDDVVEKMNTSEDGDANEKTILSSECVRDGAVSSSVNGEGTDQSRSEHDASEINVCGTEKVTETPDNKVEQNAVSAEETVSKKAVETTEAAKEGRSKTTLGKFDKPRAKLNIIIQKLIDSMPARIVPLSKATLSTTNTTISNSNHNNTYKVSPTSSSSAVGTSARLVDYHQQHVSPRKRILRDLEKVSLEDNSNSVAGGKRSRAKGSSVPIPTTMSSPRAHSITASTGAATSAQGSTTVANGNHFGLHHYQQQQHEHRTPCHQTEVPKVNKSDQAVATATTTVSSSSTSSVSTVPAPTRQRLYSSYSIHSLLGGGSGSASSSCPTSSSTSKRPNDQAIVSSANYTHQPQYMDPSYLRIMLASPKSPESHHQHHHHNPPHNSSNTTNINNPINYGGKSPSSSVNRKQRSPPYASPIHEGNSRSPAASHADYGRQSPRTTPPESSYKMRYTPEQLNSVVNHSHQLGPQHASFYSQYLLSPKYQGTSAAVMSPNSTRSTNHGHVPNANTPPSFNSSNNTPFSSATQHIPNPTAPLYASGSSALTGKSLGGSRSPPRSLTASPRDSTPRTVPKKTASIRRQFASPTASSTTSSCASPSTEHRSHLEDPSGTQTTASSAHQHDRKTPVVTTAQQPTHSLLQRSSPLGSVSPILHHHYYMYPPVANSASATHPHASVSNAAAYIPTVMPSVGGLPSAPTLHSGPSYYNPYISTIAALQRNQMWMQYPGGILPVMPPHHSAAAASRLAPQFHGFSYNGNAAMAAAAAAAVAFGGGTPQQLHAPAVVSMYGNGGSGGHPDRPRTPKLTDNTDLSTKVAAPNRPATSRAVAPESTPILNKCIKDEQSSDVPLNLSKH